jgi:hypothetical protein
VNPILETTVLSLTLQDQEQTFSAREFIFVNKSDPPPRPPHEDAPPEEVLKYQRDNMWIGRIQQAKAETPQKVWLRVFWLYWPAELPMGAQHYHGQAELILSNYTDIIDATTISGRAEISHWDEFKDEDDDKDLNSLYWRQTFDCSRLGPKNKGGLSMLRKHCICRKEYNPDKTMFKCLRAPDCGIWNHSECLERDLRSELEARLEKWSLTGYLDRRAAAFEAEQVDQQRSLGSTIAVGATAVVSAATTVFNHARHAIEASTPEVETDTSFDTGKTPLKSPTKSRKKGRDSRNLNRLHISISSSGPGSEDGNSAVIAKVKLLPANEADAEVKEWTIKLDCLKCGKPLD